MADGSNRANIVGDLRRETEAARGLLANMRDIIGDDDEVVASTIEGETNLLEAIGQGVKRLAELDALMAATKTLIDGLRERQQRFDNQYGLIRDALAVAMESGEVKKIELPLATISLKRVPPSAIVGDEWLIPEKFWKPQAPTLDKRAVLEALKAGEVIPGATLSNGGQSLNLRFK